VNGKGGDAAYTDMVFHNDDRGEPEIAARVRALHGNSGGRVERLVSDLLALTFPPHGETLNPHYRQMLREHLTTIEMFVKAESLRS
jgi:hypothetical protein